MSAGSRFLISASTLMSSTIVAQAITFGLSFILTRLYDPAEFGRFSIFVGVAGVLGAASTGALDRVVLLARSDRESQRAAATALMLAAAAALLVSAIGLALGIAGVASALPLEPIDLALLIPLFMMSYAGGQVFTYACLRQNKVRRLAAFKVAQTSSVGAVQLLLASVKEVAGLILGSLAGWSLLLAAGVRWRLQQGRLRSDLRLRSAKALIRRHWRYPRYVMPNEALDNLSNQVPVFLVGSFLSLAAAGYYGLAIMMLSAPAALIGQAVGQAFLQYMSGHTGESRLLETAVKRIWVAMASIGAAPFLLIFIYGPEIFSAAFGGDWSDAGQVARYLAPLLFIRFVSSPTSTVYLKLGMQREQWWFCLAAATYRTIAYSLGMFGANLRTMIMVHVAAETVAIVLYNWVAVARLRSPSAWVRAVR